MNNRGNGRLYFNESKSYWSYYLSGVQVVIGNTAPSNHKEKPKELIEISMTKTLGTVLKIQLHHMNSVDFFEDNEHSRKTIQRWIDYLIDGININESAVTIFEQLTPIVRKIFEEDIKSYKVCYFAGFALVGGYIKKENKIRKIYNPLRWID